MNHFNQFLLTLLNCGRKPFKHKCELPSQPKVSSYFFETDQYIQRAFREMFLVASNLKLRRCYIKSFRAIEQDRAIHLTQHYYMIHPFSVFRFYWEIFAGVAIMFALVLIPFLVMDSKDDLASDFLIALIFQSILAIDMILNFFTGYVGPDNFIIFTPKKVARKYFTTFFVLDFLSILPIGGLLTIAGIKEGDALLCRFSVATMFLSVIKLGIYSNRFRQKTQISVCRFRFVQSVVIVIIGIQVFAGVMCIAINLDQQTNIMGNNYELYLSAAALTVFGTNKIRFLFFGYEIVVRFLIVIFSFVMTNVIIAQIVLIAKSIYTTNRKFKCVMREIEEYCRYKDLPPNLEKGVYNHYIFKFNGNYFDDKPLFAMISDNIRAKIYNHTYQVLLKAELFKNCPRQLIESFFMYIKIDTYLTNDLVYRAGSIADKILFLNTGTLAIFTPEMLEIGHIEEGSTLCEYSLMLAKKLKHRLSVYAVERSEIFCLHRDDFRKIILHHPEEYEKIIEAIEAKIAKDSMMNPSLISYGSI